MVRASNIDAQAAIYFLNLMSVVDAMLVATVATCRSNRPASTANFACVVEICVLWVALTSVIIVLVSVSDDGGAFLNDTHCIDIRD
jgi:hypothetical protein